MADYGRHGVAELAHQLVVQGMLARRAYEQPPGLILTGPGGAGHTTALEAIAADLSELPHVVLNAAHVTAVAAGQPPSIPDLITSMTFELVRKPGPQWTFPRYLIGRLVIELPLNEVLTARAIDEVRAELVRVKDPDAFAARLTTIVTAVPLPGLQDVPDGAVQDSISLLIRGLNRWRPTRRLALMTGVEWYRGANGSDPLAELVALNRLTRIPGADAAASVVRILLRAFLADVRAHAPRWSRARGLVLLLDNADSAPAVAFLKGLAAVRDDAGPAAPADNLTVLAASRGPLLSRLGIAADAFPRDVSEIGGLLARRAGAPRWLPVALPPLSTQDTNALVNDLGIPVADRYRLVRTVTDLTHNHPLAAGLLLRAAAQPTQGAGRGAPDRYDPTELLARRVPADPDAATAEQQILGSLLRGLPAALQDDLVTLAAARTHAEADLIAHRSPLLRTAVVADRAPLLSRAYWCVPALAGEAAMHPLLRRLLLRRLAARTATGRRWSDVFGWLARTLPPAPAAGGPEPSVLDPDAVSRLHHALALGQLLPVATRLAELLPALDGGEWLRVTTRIVVTPAPEPLGAWPARDLQKTVRNLAGTGGAPPPLAVTVARLLGAWRAADDPLVIGERADLHTLVASCLNAVTESARSEFSIIDAEANRHRELARAWSEGADRPVGDQARERAGSVR